MQEPERVETVVIDGERSLQLEYGRRWPKYVVAWSIRKQAGESDFPVASGEVDSMPPKGEENLDAMWDELRSRAVSESGTAIPEEPPKPDAPRSFLDKLLGRG